MLNTEKYCQIPYKAHGRDFDGCDCYGLVRLVLKHEFNKETPDFSEDYISSEDANEISKLIDKNQPLIANIKKEKPHPGDIAVFKFYGKPCHIGIYIGNNRILHILKKFNFSVCEKLNSPHLKGRLEGFYEVQ